MRVAIALLFPAAVFACAFTSGTVVSAFETFGSSGISDPGFLLAKFRAALHGHAFATVLATLALLFMMVNALIQRATAKGLAIGVCTLIVGALAALAVLDLGSVFKIQSEVQETSATNPIYFSSPSPFGRMSLTEVSPRSVHFILSMANKRALTSLCLLSLGISLTLIGGRAKPPAIPPSS